MTRLREIIQVAAAFAIPLFAVEFLHVWTMYRNKRIKRDKFSKRSRSKSMKKNVTDTDIQESKPKQSRQASLHDSSFSSTDSLDIATQPTKSHLTAKQTKIAINKQNTDALFFPENFKKAPCRDYYFYNNCQKRNCTESHDLNSSVGKLLQFIFKSRDSIDICQYTVTSAFLADAILARYRLGVKVRVITDHEGSNQSSSQIESFYNQGIQIRTHTGTGLMHNKFIILDRKVVITGSFNFTTQAIIENYENLVVTDNLDIVGKFVSNFDKLWTKFNFKK